MEIYTTARIIHVLAVVLWIGGVAMVTTVILPAVRKMKNPEDQLDTFEQLENRFSLQAKITTVLTAITGFLCSITSMRGSAIWNYDFGGSTR